MQMDSGLDTGDILLSQKLALNGSETASNLIKTTSEIGAKLLIETIKNIKNIKSL